MVKYMDAFEYKKIVKKHLPKENRWANVFISFVVGGILGLLSEFASYILVMSFGVSKIVSYSLVALIIIFLSSLFTALSFFDSWVTKCKCGLIIPTTGFAHSVTSSALEYKNDGLITGVGANFFKLAGSVILYGIVSAFFLCLLKVMIYG